MMGWIPAPIFTGASLRGNNGDRTEVTPDWIGGRRYSTGGTPVLPLNPRTW